MKKDKPQPPGNYGSFGPKGHRVVYSAKNKRSIPEHRAVWEFYFGPLAKSVHVRHKNQKPLDNRPENLEVWNLFDLSKPVHDGARMKLRKNSPPPWVPAGISLNCGIPVRETDTPGRDIEWDYDAVPKTGPVKSLRKKLSPAAAINYIQAVLPKGEDGSYSFAASDGTVHSGATPLDAIQAAAAHDLGEENISRDTIYPARTYKPRKKKKSRFQSSGGVELDLDGIRAHRKKVRERATALQDDA